MKTSLTMQKLSIKILDKYPVAEYSKALAEDSNDVALLSNDNDFSWGLDLNGTTLWSVSSISPTKDLSMNSKEIM